MLQPKRGAQPKLMSVDRIHVVHEDAEHILNSWHHTCISSANQDVLWMFRRGQPYGPSGEEDDDLDDICIYYAQVKRTNDLNYQLAMLMPPPDWLNWKKFADVVEGGPTSYVVHPVAPMHIATQIRDDLVSCNYHPFKV